MNSEQLCARTLTLMCPTLGGGEAAHSGAPPRASSESAFRLYHHLYLPSSSEASKCPETHPRPHSLTTALTSTRVSELDSSMEDAPASSVLCYFYFIAFVFLVPSVYTPPLAHLPPPPPPPRLGSTLHYSLLHTQTPGSW